MFFRSYDYHSLSSGNKRFSRPSSRFWKIFGVALLVIYAIALSIYAVKTRRFFSLDYFEPLNNAPVIDWPPETYPSQSTAINPDEHAVVSSLYTDSYIRPIITLGHSLKSVNMNVRMILVYIPGSVSPGSLCLATAAGWTLHQVSRIAPPHHGKGVNPLYLDQFTKLNIWTLDSIGIKSLIYLDADTLVRRNFSELFTLPFNFAAVPDIYLDHRGFTVEFNAGVLFLRPSTPVFKDMLSKIEAAMYPPSMAEQAFLNAYFGLQAIRLPYAYNANIAIKARSPELWKAMVDDLCIVHYTLDKPFPLQGQGRQSLKEFFDSPLDTGSGIWAEEISWWQEAWRETSITMKNRVAHC